MTTLIDFLEARLKEDYDHAYHAQGILGTPSPWWKWNDLKTQLPSMTRRDAQHIELHSPARVLREVQAKRAILEAHTENNRQDHPHDCIRHAWYERESFCWVIRQMAAAYNDHTDYEPAWEPEAWPEWVPLGHTAGEHEGTP